jgi:hypothetical protein
MKFQPKSEQEIADSRLLPKGEYDFEILDAEEKISAAGNDTIQLMVRVSNGNGLTRTLTDYLVAQRAGKLRNCCAACGLLEQYDRGAVNDNDFPGKRGRLKLMVEKKKGYPDRNTIADYLTNEAA